MADIFANLNLGAEHRNCPSRGAACPGAGCVLLDSISPLERNAGVLRSRAGYCPVTTECPYSLTDVPEKRVASANLGVLAMVSPEDGAERQLCVLMHTELCDSVVGVNDAPHTRPRTRIAGGKRANMAETAWDIAVREADEEMLGVLRDYLWMRAQPAPAADNEDPPACANESLEVPGRALWGWLPTSAMGAFFVPLVAPPRGVRADAVGRVFEADGVADSLKWRRERTDVAPKVYSHCSVMVRSDFSASTAVDAGALTIEAMRAATGGARPFALRDIPTWFTVKAAAAVRIARERLAAGTLERPSWCTEPEAKAAYVPHADVCRAVLAVGDALDVAADAVENLLPETEDGEPNAYLEIRALHWVPVARLLQHTARTAAETELWRGPVAAALGLRGDAETADEAAAPRLADLDGAGQFAPLLDVAGAPLPPFHSMYVNMLQQSWSRKALADALIDAHPAAAGAISRALTQIDADVAETMPAEHRAYMRFKNAGDVTTAIARHRDDFAVGAARDALMFLPGPSQRDEVTGARARVAPVPLAGNDAIYEHSAHPYWGVITAPGGKDGHARERIFNAATNALAATLHRRNKHGLGGSAPRGGGGAYRDDVRYQGSGGRYGSGGGYRTNYNDRSSYRSGGYSYRGGHRGDGGDTGGWRASNSARAAAAAYEKEADSRF